MKKLATFLALLCCVCSINVMAQCTVFSGGPYPNIQDNFPTEGNTWDSGFGAWANESYQIEVCEGGNYTFEFCSGYDPNVWSATITVGYTLDGTTVSSIIGTTNGCSINFTTPVSGDVLLITSDANDCGGLLNQTDNGNVTFTNVTMGINCIIDCDVNPTWVDVANTVVSSVPIPVCLNTGEVYLPIAALGDDTQYLITSNFGTPDPNPLDDSTIGGITFTQTDFDGLNLNCSTSALLTIYYQGVNDPLCFDSLTLDLATDPFFTSVVNVATLCGTSTSGCMDIAACNYDALATTDDGSCDYGFPGCPDPCCISSCPFDPNSCVGAIPLTITQGICNNTVVNNTGFGDSGDAVGCSEFNGGDAWFSFKAPASGNVNLEVSSSNFSSIYVNILSGFCGNLSSFYCNEAVGFGTLNEANLTGLTPGATYYAQVYDDTGNNFGNVNICVFEPVLGCTDPCFTEYNPSATNDDGSCVTNVTATTPCDDGSACTSNDVEILGLDGSVCVPCAGTTGTISGSGTPVCEDFEATLEPNLPECWTATSNNGLGGQGTFGWQTQIGPTTSNGTGPTTGNNGSTTYIYMEATGGDGTDTLFTPTYDLSNGIFALDFYYHMLSTSATDPTLEVFIESPANSGNLILLFSNTGDQGNVWNNVSIDLSTYTGFVSFLFVGDDNDDFMDVALDDICILEAIPGCTDPCFAEYSPTANIDDGSCATALTTFTPCDDNNPCTINDVELLGADGSVCVPCEGMPGPIPVAGATPICEDFETTPESNLPSCWFNSNNDGLDWQAETGTTPSSGTGPSSGNNGSTTYIYMEASGGNGTDSLFTPIYDLSGGAFALDFYYHMLNTSTTDATLEVFIESPANSGNLTLLFTITGDQGNAWNNQVLDLTAYSGPINLIFVANDNGGFMDIALDDICIVDAVFGCNSPCFLEYDPDANVDDGSCVTAVTNFTPCDDNNPCTINDVELLGVDGSVCVPCQGTAIPIVVDASMPFCEDFESTTPPNLPNCWSANSNNGLGGQNGFGWQTETFATTFGTGPTAGNDNSLTYIYMDAAGIAGTDTLYSPTYDLGTTAFALDFHYFIGNAPINSSVLEVYVESPANSGNLTLLFSVTGNQGADWQQAIIDLTPYNNLVNIIFVATDDIGNVSIALDDICLEEAVPGCPDPCFLEYTPNANVDDGSCITAVSTFTPCDDNNPCTINDIELLGVDGSVCIPCTGTVVPLAVVDGTQIEVCEDFETIEPDLPSCWSASSNNGSGGQGGFGWQTETGTTTSNNTGPTDGNNGSTTYIYMEASGPNGTDTLFSPIYDLNSGDFAIDFYYHMLGPTVPGNATPGTFEVWIESPANSGNLTLLFTQNGNQGSAWNQVNIPLMGYTGLVNFLFVVDDNEGFGDVALDDFCVYATDLCALGDECVEILRVCRGNALYIDCMNPVEVYTYTWTNEDTGEQVVVVDQPGFTPSEPGTYSVTINNPDESVMVSSCEPFVIEEFIDCRNCGK